MTDGLNNHERQQWAWLLYTKHDKTVKEIALTVGADEACVRNWAQAGEWDGVKRSLLTSKSTRLKNLYDFAEKLDEKMKSASERSAKDVELMLKFTDTITKLEKGIGVAQIIEVAELFTGWLLPRDLELTQQFTAQLNAFVKERLRAA